MSYLERVAKAVSVSLAIASLVAVVVVCMVLATDALLIGFLAILFAVFLVRVSTLLAKYIPLGYGANLALVLTLLLGMTGGGLFFFGVAIEEQLQASSKKIDESAEKLRGWLKKQPMTRKALERIPFAGEILKPGSSEGNTDTEKKSPDSESSGGSDSEDAKKEDSDKSQSEDGGSRSGKDKSSGDVPGLGGILEKASSVSGSVLPAVGKLFSTSFGLVMNVAFVFFVGVFLAVDPELYRKGFQRLFPKSQRPRVDSLLSKTGGSLFHWLIGRLMSMALTGLGTGIGLWLLGVPMAATVGVITAVLTFIPNIGAVLALVLAMLLALSQGPTTVLWVVAIYAGLQLIESNILTPLIQQQQTSIPPALLISFQLLMGVLTGFLGVMVATPLLAAIMVLVQELWVKDVLGDNA